MNQKNLELRVGIVAILGIVLLILGVSFGEGLNVSVSKQTVKFMFNNSSGIQAGSPVVVAGVRRGIISTVENVKEGVLITADLNYIDDIKSDASARITILEVTGGKKLELNPGISGKPFDINKCIPGMASADIADLVADLGKVSGSAASLILRLDTVMVAANNVLDKNSTEKLKSTINDLSEISHNVNRLLKDNYGSLQTTFRDLKVIVADLKTGIKKYEPEVGVLISKLEVTLANADKLMNGLDKTVNNADALVNNVNGVVSDVKNGNGLVTRLIYDKALATQLDSTLNQLNILVNQINNHGINVNVRLGTRP